VAERREVANWRQARRKYLAKLSASAGFVAKRKAASLGGDLDLRVRREFVGDQRFMIRLGGVLCIGVTRF